jgi:hypothetical protein
MDNEAIRSEAGRILTDPDFQQYYHKEQPFDFWRWLNDMLDFKMPFEPHYSSQSWAMFGMAFKGIVIFLALAALVAVIYWIVSKLARRPPPEVETYGITQEQRQEAKDKYARLAADALKEHDYRLAIHYLFLAAVSQVIKESSFHAADFMTNREIAESTDFSAFEQSGQVNRLFHEMVYFDEPRWFGRASVPEHDYQNFQQLYSRFSSYLEGGRLRRRHV